MFKLVLIKFGTDSLIFILTFFFTFPQLFQTFYIMFSTFMDSEAEGPSIKYVTLQGGGV